MMFLASKLLAFAIEPLAWVLLPLLAAVALRARWPKAAGRLVWTALAALLLGGWIFIPESILRHLEQRYPPLPAGTDMRHFAGVVVLGGALARSELWTEHRQVALNDHAERMTEAFALARTHPELTILFTGGIADVRGTGLTEAQRAQIFFTQMGLAPDRVLYEDRSRTTFENAVNSAALPGVDRTRPWLLLTSAFHMPRAMGVFRRAGWNVTPYPVDYDTGSGQSWLDFSFHYGPQAWTLALHEVLGFYAYRMAGMI